MPSKSGNSNIVVMDEESYLRQHPTAKRIIAILEDITYTQRDITWLIGSTNFGGTTFMDPYRPIWFRISISGIEDVQSGESISLFMPPITIYGDMKDEWILETAYRAIRTFEMHELDEHFFYKGRKIHDPHHEETKATLDRQASLIGDK